MLPRSVKPKQSKLRLRSIIGVMPSTSWKRATIKRKPADEGDLYVTCHTTPSRPSQIEKKCQRTEVHQRRKDAPGTPSDLSCMSAIDINEEDPRVLC